MTEELKWRKPLIGTRECGVYIGDTFTVENWRYTVIRRSANLPDSMVFCKIEHMTEMIKPIEGCVWICDLLKTRRGNDNG